MSGDVVPFGRYKGQSVADMLADADYMAWVEAQPWFRERYLHLLSRRDADAASRTPVHNRLQTLFLDQAYQLAFIQAVQPSLITSFTQESLEQRQAYLAAALQQENATEFAKLIPVLQKEPYWSSSVRFESNGGDVCIETSLKAWCLECAWSYGAFPQKILPKVVERNVALTRDRDVRNLIIEIKPTVADEYPAILRQMDRNRSRYLFVEEYIGIGATEAQFVAVFAASGKHVVFKREVDRIVAASVLAKLDAAGVLLTLQPSGKVTITAGAQPAAELIAGARVHRDAIIAFLRERAAEATQLAQPLMDNDL